MAERRQTFKLLRAGSLLLAFFVVRGAAAGEQLTLEQLVKDSTAVAIVDNPLRSDVAVRRWLRSTEPPGPFSLTSPLCIPDKEMLQRWKKQTPSHPGAPTWDRSLALGYVDQIVFFHVVKGVAVPRCETEVMLGTTFSTHPDYKKTLAEVERLLDLKLGPATPPSPPPAPPPEPVPPPAPAPAPAPAPTGGSGCL